MKKVLFLLCISMMLFAVSTNVDARGHKSSGIHASKGAGHHSTGRTHKCK